MIDSLARNAAVSLRLPYSHRPTVRESPIGVSEQDGDYVMSYDESDRSYNARILQKQGYYSYQYLLRRADGQTAVVPEEGSFFETENKYQAFVYYKGVADRTWRLVGYQQIYLR